jgi:Tfp pilus assembly protein PilP
MRSQVFVPLVAVSVLSIPLGAAAQPPKPATGSTAPTGQPAAPPAAPQTPPAPPSAPAAPPQTPPSAPAAPGAPPAGTPLPPPSSESYTYQAEGRRDPFQNLITAPSETGRRANMKIGPAGMTVAEIQVRGVIQSSRGLLAMVLGSDNKTYIVHQGDPLLDGKIKQITPQGLIITQEVNDPLSLVKEREVRKLLRSLEDAK